MKSTEAQRGRVWLHSAARSLLQPPLCTSCHKQASLTPSPPGLWLLQQQPAELAYLLSGEDRNLLCLCTYLWQPTQTASAAKGKVTNHDVTIVCPYLAHLNNNCILLAAYTQDQGTGLSPGPCPGKGNRLGVNVPSRALITAFLISIFPSMLFAILILAANSSLKK